MITELRIYTCVPGALPRLLRRFEEVTLPLWDRHGIRPAGFWTTAIGAGLHDLTYMINWDSMADRETRWTAFQTDPDWIAGRTESERPGPILQEVVSSFLKPVVFPAR